MSNSSSDPSPSSSDGVGVDATALLVARGKRAGLEGRWFTSCVWFTRAIRSATLEASTCLLATRVMVTSDTPLLQECWFERAHAYFMQSNPLLALHDLSVASGVAGGAAAPHSAKNGMHPSAIADVAECGAAVPPAAPFAPQWEHISLRLQCLARLKRYKDALIVLRDVRPHIRDDDLKHMNFWIMHEKVYHAKYTKQLADSEALDAAESYVPFLSNMADADDSMSEAAAQAAPPPAALPAIVISVAACGAAGPRCRECSCVLSADVAHSCTCGTVFCSEECQLACTSHRRWQCSVHITDVLQFFREQQYTSLLLLAQLLGHIDRTQNLLEHCTELVALPWPEDETPRPFSESWNLYRAFVELLGLHPAWFDYYTFDVARGIIEHNAVPLYCRSSTHTAAASVQEDGLSHTDSTADDVLCGMALYRRDSQVDASAETQPDTPDAPAHNRTDPTIDDIVGATALLVFNQQPTNAPTQK